MKKSKGCLMKLFLIGGVSYGLIEIIWRKYTHWSMVLTGGICFIILYRIFTQITACSLWLKCCIGSTVITLTEFFSGFIFNFCLKLKVWDYSKFRLNFCGQICALYSFLWGLLTIPITAVCNRIYKKYHW